MRGDKAVDYIDPDDPILVGQSSADLQSELMHGNLARGDLTVKLAEAQKIVAAMSPDDPERSKAMRILAMNLYARFFRTRKKKYLNLAIQSGSQSLLTTSIDLSNLAAMYYSRYELANELDDLEEAISKVTLAIPLELEDSPKGRILYTNLSGYLLQRYNRSKSLKDLKEAFCVSAAATANSLKWDLHREIFGSGTWQNSISSFAFLIPVFLRHGIVLPTLRPSAGSVKAWKEEIINLFDEATMQCLLEIFDCITFKTKNIRSFSTVEMDDPRYLRTREAELSEVFVSESGSNDPVVIKGDPTTTKNSRVNFETSSDSPDEKSSDEMDYKEFKSSYIYMELGKKRNAPSGPPKNGRFIRFGGEDIPYSLPEHRTKAY
jgi:hypothetical protein